MAALPSELTLPTITVTARSRGDPSKPLAQLGPLETLDLSGRIKEVAERIRTRTVPARDEISIESVVEFVDGQRLPELFLEPSVIADFVKRRARLDVQFRKTSGIRMKSSLAAIRVEFVVRGLGFDPAALTQRLGLEPDEVNRSDRARSPRSLDTWTYGGRTVGGARLLQCWSHCC
jgi:hypothetical protein